ncbi:hypothetical protein, partial [Dyella sp.]|uniref:hypothetical protein n=1 Tax=Dyella sp. TaxID=1869338 RepID=UPI00284D8371
MQAIKLLAKEFRLFDVRRSDGTDRLLHASHPLFVESRHRPRLLEHWPHLLAELLERRTDVLGIVLAVLRVLGAAHTDRLFAVETEQVQRV